MAWARFIKDFEFDFRPQRAICQTVRASEKPQSWPERLITAAIEAGAAVRAESPLIEQPQSSNAPKGARKRRTKA